MSRNKIIEKMKCIRGIAVTTIDNYLVTSGLNEIIDFEVSLLTNGYEEWRNIEILEYLINYFIDTKPIIKPEQTIAYYSWMLRFVLSDDKRVNIYEVSKDGLSFIEGVDYAIAIIKAQTEQCVLHESEPLFPTFSQMIIVSKGVIEGNIVDAVRYLSPEHMSGWWLTTDLYDGDIKSLETVHYSHVIFARPEIIKFLALPFGFRFASDEKEAWFDEDEL